MALKLTAADWRAIFPRAPQSIIDAFTNNSAPLDAVGITETKTRLAYALANVEHECGGFTIPNLTENVRYTAARMASVWPNRFKNAAAVEAKYGTGPGWQKKAFDDIYGGRMGNRIGTSDGSRYIGRGGPQVTGRDGYAEVGTRAWLDLVNKPELACAPEHQPAILAAFWSWKNLNRFADADDFTGCVKAWNGGTNGMADRLLQLKGNSPVLARLTTKAGIEAAIGKPGAPTPVPPPPDIPKPSKAPDPVAGPPAKLGWVASLLQLFRKG
jgi:predicted chitinase